MSKVLWLSDFGLQGSGYLNISVPLCTGLTQLGYDVKAVGLQYQGEEHWFNFSVIPAVSFSEGVQLVNNLYYLWQPDILVVALDMPLQEALLQQMNRWNIKIKYIGITPLEAPPLMMSWAMMLHQMNKVFIISDFGTKEAHKLGVDAEHLIIGVDTDTWRTPSKDERKALRDNFGFDDDTFVVLTVADNQERKHLSASFEAVQKLKELNKDNKNFKVKYIVVTRVEFQFGWRLGDLSLMYGIQNDVMFFERGMTFKELWSLYAISDAFLLLSKAEGLGMPILEAMSVGLPVVASNCTALSDHLDESNRGYGVFIQYSIIDPFGNQERYFVNVQDAAYGLSQIYHNSKSSFWSEKIENAKKYVAERKWEQSVLQLDKAIKVLRDEQTAKEND